MTKKTFYISTPIYYPSGKPHIGHAYSTILADVINRYKKLIGYETFFVTGTDEHGKKIEIKAKESNLEPLEYVNKMSSKFVELWNLLGVKYDYFSRTTNPHHIKTIQQIYDIYNKKGLIYLDQWIGWYCTSCEENITPKDIFHNQKKAYCPQGHELIQVKEESYFFKMSKFNNWIQNYFKLNDNFILPNSRMNELKHNFLDSGLTDLSISRSSFNWGIPIKNTNHVIYVWMDALFNYLTALNFLEKDDSLYQKFWNNPNGERVHILSKEITRFHCIYWPIFLDALDIKLPTKIISHGWILSSDGNKMSKSIGTVIDPYELLNKYSRDFIRYYLIKDMSLSNDNLFSEQALIATCNGDLANNYGNLVSRSIGMLSKYNNGIIPKFNHKDIDNQQQIIINHILTLNKENINSINEFNLNKLLVDIQKLINECNQLIEASKPWELFKENKINQLNNILVILFKVIEFATYWLEPILIDGVVEVIDQTNLKPTLKSINDINSNENIKVNQSKPIYLRINIKENNNESKN